MSLAMGGAARRGKPKIRPPKKYGPEISVTDMWTKLAYAIGEIQNGNAFNVRFAESYGHAYNMVLFKHGDTLHKGVKKLIAEHLERLADNDIVPNFPRSSGTDGAGKLGGGAEAIERALAGDVFLKSLRDVWVDHNLCVKKLKTVLVHLDRYAVSMSLPVTETLGATSFLQNVIHSSKHPIHTHLIATLLSQVQLERDGVAVTRSSVRECVDVLLRLTLPEQQGGSSVYAAEFEPEFLRRSAEFYTLEAIRYLDIGDAGHYLRNVERRLAEENERTAHYLSIKTQAPLAEILVAVFLTVHLQAILSTPGSGLVAMIDTDRIADLRRLYNLFLEVPQSKGKDALRIALRMDIEQRGRRINESADEPIEAGPSGEAGMDVDADIKGKGKAKAPAPVSASSTALTAALRWVQDVLDLKDKFDSILEQAFVGDLAVQSSINESFINTNPRAPEFLSLFIDEHLKKGTKAKTDDEIDIALEKTIILFRFLQDKDKFERYYKTHLARRLLYARSASDDAEKGMVAKLKVEMGFQFTQKLEGMFTDMRISTESANQFRNFQARHELHVPFDLTVSVLTASYWPQPIVAAVPCTFGPTLKAGTGAFERFYDSRHSGRRLTWQGSLGTADVRVRFKARSHDLNLSTQALVVLLLFEDLKDESLSFADLKAATDLSDPDLQRTLQSLACGKFRILTKTPKGRDVNPTDTFTFNESFTSPLARIKIMQVASKVETSKEREETQEMVDEERKHQVEACIVRVMKDRKTMSHNDLISEVAHQLSARFNPSLGMIKKRIEGLIDREYLERASDIGVYRYLA